MYIFEKEFKAAEILELRKSQYVQPLYIQDVVSPGVTNETPLPLSTVGAFLVLSFTGFYTSLMIKNLGGKTLKDLGVCPLRMKIQAGASSLQMFGDFVPMNLILTPGRVRVSPADAQLVTGPGWTLADADMGPVPNQLFYPYSYQFPFEANDTISIAVKNDFDSSSDGWVNRWGICFYGIRSRDIKKAIKETLPRKKI